jgi:hypothetical protein
MATILNSGFGLAIGNFTKVYGRVSSIITSSIASHKPKNLNWGGGEDGKCREC